MFKAGLEKYGYGVGIAERELSDKSKVPTIGHSGGINGFSTNIMPLRRGQAPCRSARQHVAGTLSAGDDHGHRQHSLRKIL